MITYTVMRIDPDGRVMVRLDIDGRQLDEMIDATGTDLDTAAKWRLVKFADDIAAADDAAAAQAEVTNSLGVKLDEDGNVIEPQPVRVTLKDLAGQRSTLNAMVKAASAFAEQ